MTKSIETMPQDKSKQMLNAFEIASRKIPPSKAIAAEYRECNGGFGSWIITTKDGKCRWLGCGHPLCAMCGLSSAYGVGDEAYRDFQEFWDHAARQVLVMQVPSSLLSPS